MVLVHVQRAVDGVEHIARVEGEEREAVVRVHRVLQAAGLADQRERAVAHRDHLRQAARLKAGRDEDDVRPRVHAVRERMAELDARRELGRVLAGVVAEGVLVFLVADAQHSQLHVALFNLRQQVGQKVQTFLLGQAADDDEERDVLVDLQPQLLLQLQFVFFFLS